MTVVWICLAVLAGLVVLCWIVGQLVPIGHCATVRARFAASAGELWGHVVEFADQPGVAIQRPEDRSGFVHVLQGDLFVGRLVFQVRMVRTSR